MPEPPGSLVPRAIADWMDHLDSRVRRETGGWMDHLDEMEPRAPRETPATPAAPESTEHPVVTVNPVSLDPRVMWDTLEQRETLE